LDHEAHLSNLLSHAPLFFFEVDLDLNFIYLNKVQSGFTKEQILGKSVIDFVPLEYKESYEQFYRSVIATHETGNFEIKAEIGPGEFGYYQFTLAPIFKDKKLTSLLGISRDITDQKNEVIKTKFLQIKAEKESLLKSNFLAEMSHEIRTPLNGVTGFAQLLTLSLKEMAIESKEFETINQYISGLNAASNSLLAIVNNILSITEIEAGKSSLNLVDCDILDLIKNARDSLQLMAEKKGIKIIIESNFNHLFVKLDKGKFLTIMNNLINNAIKYSNEGTILISVQFSENILTVNIKDEGIGISKNNLERIFKQYERIESGSTQLNEGFGIGLSLVKGYCEVMGGEISVQSTLNEGSTFTVRLLVSKSVTTANETFDSHKLTYHRALVVDDNQANLMILKSLLKKAGIQNVEVANSGFESLEKIKEFKPDIVFMDLFMPNMDGFETIEMMRKMELSVKYVMVSADAMDSTVQKALSLNIEYMTKPVVFSVLKSIINS